MESLIKSNEFLLIISLDSVEDLCRQILDELISNAFGLAASDGSNPQPASPVAEPNEFLHGRNSPSRSMGTITFTALQGLVATIAIFICHFSKSVALCLGSSQDDWVNSKSSLSFQMPSKRLNHRMKSQNVLANEFS